MRRTSAESLSTMGRGVPAATKVANQPLASKPASPSSAKVGTSGSAGWRCMPVMARMRILSDFRCALAEDTSMKPDDSCPPSTSLTSGAAPL